MTEAAKLQKKTISKGKLKKSIKSVLCRPDTVFWPAVSTEDASKLEIILNKYKIILPEYKKPHWNKIKLIAKENRPKPPTIQKVEGLVFGLSECFNAVEKQQCAALIIEATINPQTIAQPILEKCYSTKIPVVCLNNLRKICAENFGIPTSCLGIRNNSLYDLHTVISTITEGLKNSQVSNRETIEMEINTEIKSNRTYEIHNTSIKSKISECPYLYRTNKKTRVFIPSERIMSKSTREFAGQDFIELSHKENHKPDKIHMKMILKRISNNPNREKRK